MFSRVTLPTAGGDVKLVTRIELRSQEYAHDLATITVRTINKARLRRGAPISVSYGKGLFTGYVLSVSGGTRRNDPVVIKCVGMTNPCRNGRQRSWAGKTDSQIVQGIAGLVKLQAAVEPTKTKRNVNQAGKSDWQFMVERAKANGYVLYPRGAQIRFHSRSYELVRYAPAAARLRSTDILSFTPDLSDVVPGGGPKSTITLWGVDKNGTPHAGSQAPATAGATTSFNTKSVALTMAEAQELAAAEAELNSWTYRATAEVLGNPLIRVGGPVFFSDVPGDYEGYWLVQQVTHLITPTSFTTRAVVGIDQLGRGYTAPPPDVPVAAVNDPDDDIQLMDPTDPFDPESDNVVVPEDLSAMLIDFDDPYDGDQPSTDERQWFVPTIQPEDASQAYTDDYEVVGLVDAAVTDDGYEVLALQDDPPAWLLDRVYG